MDKRRLIPIFLIVFTNILGAGVILPILPLLAEGEFQATALQATTLSAVYFAAQFVAAPWLGRLSDRIGRRPVLIVSQIGTVFSFILFIFAGPIGQTLTDMGWQLGISGGLFMLYVARLLDGITGGNITTAQAYITDITPPEARAQALGIISGAFGMGFIFGPAFGGLLANVSLVAPFVGAAIITTITLLLTTFTLKESLGPEERSVVRDGRNTDIPLRTILQNRTILLVLVITVVVTLSFSALQSTFALYMERVVFPDEVNKAIVARNAGFVLTLIGMVTVITQLSLIKPLVKRFGEYKLAILGQFSLMMAFVGLSMVSNFYVVALFAAPTAFGNSINQPSLQAILTAGSEKRMRGRLLGLYQSARSLALIFGPIGAGYVFQQISPRAPYVIAIPILLVAIALSTWLLRRDNPPQTH
ncbi:MAG: MFS transporter [Ardenticatenaceae bacterium]|nr:MFS transporter [Ardenticatenaceae bacterium]MCB8991961.1 MFS transporter [Ardenticatenaceae bacterium]MCB9004900.1 MFS transporter [Ardenticatenaceae bacterium]